MRSRFGIVGLMVSGLLSASLLAAPSASAASSPCPDHLGTMNWRLDSRIVSGHYIIKSFDSSRNSSCVVVRRDDRRKIDVVLDITRDFDKKGKATTTVRRHINDVRRVVRTYNTDNKMIDVTVYANLASKSVYPYRGKLRLTRT